jgi:peptidoglycan/xylan/chitin deacetylase (PgdA/CDA1 family)
MIIRKIAGNFFAFIVWFFFSKSFVEKKFKTGNLRSVYFHNPSHKVFIYCVEWLIKSRVTFLSADNLETIINSNENPPLKGVILSLDDAWTGNLSNVFPISENFKIPLILFVPTLAIIDGNIWLNYFRNELYHLSQKGYIYPNDDIKMLEEHKRKHIYQHVINKASLPRQIMSIQQLEQTARSKDVILGGHTHSHPILTNCTDDEIIAEIEESNEFLERITKKEVRFFAYPNGSFDNRIRKIISSKYSLAFTVEQKWINLPNIDPFAIPRICVPDKYLKYETLCRLTGLWEHVINKLNLKWLK